MYEQAVAETRFGEAAVLAALAGALVAACVYGYKRGRRPWVWVWVGGYNVLLLLAYVAGLLYDRGQGLLTYLAVKLAMPWVLILPPEPVIRWLLNVETEFPGFDASLVIAVGICGAVNSIIIYTLVRALVYRNEPRDAN